MSERTRPGLAAALALVAGFAMGSARAAPPDLRDISLPDGFRIDIYARDVANARQMALGDDGVLYVGSRGAGMVYAVVDADGDFRAETVRIIARGLNLPTGVAYRDGDLYVAEVQRVLRFDDIGNHLDSPPQPVVVTDQLPADRHHGWKFIGFGPDGRLYVPVGAPCNVCLKDPPYASILRMNADGSGLETYARGIRNSVGFDWHPATGELWFTDNGRDMLGDDVPACELNRATGPGQHFGFPYMHGANTPDPEFGKMAPPAPLVPPVVELGPHVAPLGMLFYTGNQFPAAYRNAVLIAEHGSWNRSEKIGYRLAKVVLDDAGAVVSHEPFASGWLQGDSVTGRPVDLEQLPDGSVLLSDDEAGVIYRISHAADDD
jgi:glucose/arabinose dehydrogenase